MGTRGTKAPVRKTGPPADSPRLTPRQRAFAPFARQNGFSSGDGYLLGNHGVSLPWSSSDRPRWGTELAGTWRGLPVTTADVWWGGGRNAACTVAVVGLRADLPPTLIGDRRQPAPGGSRKRGEAQLWPDVVVSSTDPQFAARLMSAELREWFRSLNGAFDFWVSGGYVVAAARLRRGGRLRLLRPSELPYLLEAVRGFCLRVPPGIWAQYPPMEPDGPGPSFGWGIRPRVAISQIVPTTPWYRRVRLVDRVAGAASLAGAVVILVSFLQTWVTRCHPSSVARATGSSSPGPAGSGCSWASSSPCRRPGSTRSPGDAAYGSPEPW